MRKRNDGACPAARAWKAALALILAMGLAPAGALAQTGGEGADIDASESMELENCVIARADDPAKLEGEPIVAHVADACLLSYGTAREAEKAAERLSGICDFAEVDTPVYAAEVLEGDAGEHDGGAQNAPGIGSEADAIDDLPGESRGGDDTAGDDMPGDAVEDDPPLVEDVQDTAADEAHGLAESGRDGGSPDVSPEVVDEPAGGAAGESAECEDEEEDGVSDADEGKKADDSSAPLVALVDSGAPKGADLIGSVSVIGDDAVDANGHAARMYDAIRSQAPDARILAVRVLDENARGTVAATYAGIQEAIDQGADIINLSLYAAFDDESSAIGSAVRDACDAGIVVVAAAGNDGADAAGYVPANAAGAVTAGSCDGNGVRLPSSNYGDDVDVYVASDATSVAAARVTGWIAAHRGADGAFPDVSEAVDGVTFFANDGSGSSPESPDSVDVAEDSPVLGAMAIETPQATELRPSVSRAGSSLPRSTIYIDGGGRLPLSEASLSGSSKFSFGTYTVGHSSTSALAHYGVYVANPAKGATGTYTGTIDGSFTLKWTDVAEDEEGNRLDLALTFSNITVRTGQETAKKSDRILLVRNGSTGFLSLSSRMQVVAGTNNQPRMGVRMDILASFTKTGTQEASSGSYLFCVNDLDQPDSSVSSLNANDFSGPYAEATQLLSGFSPRTYRQKTIAQGDGPDPGASLLACDTATGKFTATQVNSYDTQMRAGFVSLSTSGTFGFRWWGSYCDTAVFSDYQGIVIRDKNDPARAGVTDQGIVTKNVNAEGLKSLAGGVPAVDEAASFDEQLNHGGRRTSTNWRATNMRWLGSSTYRISAQKGFRVVNVEVTDELGASKDLGPIRELNFASEGDDSAQTYRTDRNYDIIVTTARVPDTSATIRATKELVGRDLEDGEFTFELYEGEEKVGEARNSEAGTVTFLPIEYTYSDQESYPATHEYRVVEVSGTEERITYDSKEFPVTVVVDYSEAAGDLRATVDYEEEPDFVNVFERRGGVRVKKVDEDDGHGLSGAEFTVEAEDGAERFTMTSGDDGIAELGAATLPEGAYRVRETRAPEGYALNESWSVSFAIEEEGQVIDLTTEPCIDASDAEVELPRTGAAGVGGAMAAAFAAVAVGLIARRRIAVA